MLLVVEYWWYKCMYGGGVVFIDDIWYVNEWRLMGIYV